MTPIDTIQTPKLGQETHAEILSSVAAGAVSAATHVIKKLQEKPQEAVDTSRPDSPKPPVRQKRLTGKHVGIYGGGISYTVRPIDTRPRRLVQSHAFGGPVVAMDDDALPDGVSDDADVLTDVVKPLDRGVAALKALARDFTASQEAWAGVARVLQDVAVEERRRVPRHASLAQLVSDALSFSTPDDLTDDDEAADSLLASLEALRSRFMSTDHERTITNRLLDAGWQLTLPYRGRTYAAST